jgi:adenylate kinase
MRLVFVGPPGSGKGTQAKLLQERLGLVPIGTGDILRDCVRRGGALGHKAEPYMRSGRLVPDELVNEIVAEFFRRDDHPTQFVMDGYPRTLAQATWFEAFLHQYGMDLEHAVLFEVPEEAVVRRLSGRRLVEGRVDDTEETVRKRLAVYHESADVLIEHYREAGLLREVDATADVETVYKQIAALCAA